MDGYEQAGGRKERRGIGESIGHRFNNFRTSQVITPIVVVVLLFGLLMWGLTWAFRRLRVDGSFLPENTLPLLLIAGTLSLLLAVSAVVVIFARLGLTSWQEPLGLPRGSVRAVIALLLIVLFFITAVFLYADVGRSQSPRTLNGIDEARLAVIPTDQIQFLDQVDDNPARFDVVLTSEKNQDSKDIAKQLVTTVSTLVVAIAAFYFGSNSVQTAIEAVKQPPADSAKDPDPKPDGTDPVDDPAPPPEVVGDSTDLVAGTTADNDEVPDTSAKVTQQHAPIAGAPS